MILPTKHILPTRSLLGVGAEVLRILNMRPRTVSALWDEVRGNAETRLGGPIHYGWFVLAVDLLYLMGIVDLRRGVLERIQRAP